ncbi:MAG: hypothetical protein LBN39_03640 [Planctomycetaceae bacterium]|jgi:phenylacetate-CoA ligase|nr:hypothetical protein [Planctomycetaceae bacterium]
MDLFAPISRNIIAPLAAWREGSPYLKVYKQMLRTQYEPPEVIRQRQTEKLRAMVQHAYKTTKFWKERFANAGIKPEDIQTLEDLRKLPLLTKTDLRTRLDDMISSDYPDKSKLVPHETSGSTGVSVVVYSDNDCMEFKRGNVLRHDEWSGWRRGERVASLWTVEPQPFHWWSYLRNKLLSRHYARLYTLKMNEKSINEFVDKLVKYPPSLIFGHAHSFYLLAEFLKKKRPEVKIRPNGIITTAMVLYDHERPVIEEVFHCKPTNRYGCEEVSLIACECEKHEGLHVNLDTLHVEVIDANGNPCPPLVPGRVIVTDLINRAMPILRYEIGDTASWSDKQCSCGRTLPLFSRIEGRVADYVVTKRGEYISGISLTTFFACELPGFAQFQIIQEDIDRFTFNVVKGEQFTEQSIADLDRLVKQRFGDDVRYECNFMDEIPREKSGKYRFCISKVEKSF